jgi:hypothetical protein
MHEGAVYYNMYSLASYIHVHVPSNAKYAELVQGRQILIQCMASGYKIVRFWYTYIYGVHPVLWRVRLV